MTPGFHKMPNEVTDQLAEMGLPAYGVYSVLSRLADEHGVAWPSIGCLVERTGLCVRSVRAALRTLESAGLILTRERREGTQRLSNSYEVLAHPRAPRHEMHGRGAPGDREGGTTVPQPPAPEDRDPRHPEHPYSYPMTKTQVTKTGRGGAARVDVTIPEVLSGEDFQAAWGEWLSYRRERRLSCTHRALTAQLAKLAEWGPTDAIAAIRESIRQGWQGLFAPKRNGHAGRQPLAVGPGQRHPADRTNTVGTF